jgi:trehalose-phosphatase
VTSRSWREALVPLIKAAHPLLALDFDGTLAPLVEDPNQAHPVAGTSPVLQRLTVLSGVTVALVSGRPAAELAVLAQPPAGTLLVGSHGAQTGIVQADGIQLDPSILPAANAANLKRVTAELERLASSAGGAWVEHKPFAAVFHTRPMADRVLASNLERQAAAVGAGCGGIVQRGKMVVEVAVVEADKATALQTLRVQTGADRLLFAGDDLTDERAFRVIEPPDLSVKVGQGPTAAQLRVADPVEMVRLLAYLTDRLAAARDLDRPFGCGPRPAREP